ncbi:hypothetical protein SPOG_03261 [Schizosaccharomyces cryophilus OY26]|uniref:Uncharacterized protein n=1 Tax=Schizosaccharomyces cryophilus (strain OY26 / ATCC MYA-4695 / CBS 11777 / NBRC 106824 / NRRL Y48691) TaxID=653667 RepID=S9X7M5_SCHCR|nr:uncharacterized protein SPOG_03261 [Schizosaccharomyces cryophilus OY26]EPY49786.1 hypothetical protein SPOG_03261 [Schizosaccharomyces cryophilus OY26]
MFSQRLTTFKSFPLSKSCRNVLRTNPLFESSALPNRWYSNNSTTSGSDQPLHRIPAEEDAISPKDNASRDNTTDSEAYVRSDWDNTPIEELERETAIKSKHQRSENISVNDRKSPPSVDEL